MKEQIKKYLPDTLIILGIMVLAKIIIDANTNGVLACLKVKLGGDAKGLCPDDQLPILGATILILIGLDIAIRRFLNCKKQ